MNLAPWTKGDYGTAKWLTGLRDGLGIHKFGFLSIHRISGRVGPCFLNIFEPNRRITLIHTYVCHSHVRFIRREVAHADAVCGKLSSRV